MKFNRNTILLVIITALFLGLLFVINMEDFRTIRPPEPIRQVPVETPRADEVTVPVSNFTVLVPKDVCEGCHMSGKPVIPQALGVRPHINGGAYCLICHKISHEVHPIDQNVTCEKCHGTTPTAPAYINGTITCNNCHDYPDPLLPSKGNIITIHRPRGITCNTCHTDQCTNCHREMGTSARWEKRLAHFSVILSAQ